MGRAFRVQALDRTEMEETGAILAALEGLALSLSGDISPEQLAQLSEIDRDLGAPGATRTARDLDSSGTDPLQGCPNTRLLSMISSLWQVPRRYMRAFLRDAGRVSLSTQHHSRIIEALRRNDREAALRRFSHHWQRGMEELSAWIGR